MGKTNETLTPDQFAERLEICRSRWGDLWALRPDAMQSVVARCSEEPPDPPDPEAAAKRLPRVRGKLAIMPLHGIITQRGDYWGGTSTDAFGRALDTLMASKEVEAVVIDVESPGGTLYGVPELAGRIREVRGVKPIIAVANSEAASAAYWLASQASQMIVTPSGAVGSIGVWVLHVDYSAMLAEVGVKPTFIHAGKYKVEGNPFEPLGEEARTYYQARIDERYQAFVSDVARGREVSPNTVRNDFGEGRMMLAEAAKAAGMVDRIATFVDVVETITAGQKSRATAERGLDAIFRLAEAEDVEP